MADDPAVEGSVRGGSGPVVVVGDGVEVRVRLTPKAARDRFDGVHAEADGTAVFKLAVTAPPEDGKANAALVRFLAKAWKVPKSAVVLVAGATDRRKRLRIDGDSAALAARIEHWVRDNHG